MWVLMLVLLLLGAHLNLAALVPLQPGDPSPPWWVGGRLIWPFAVETRTLIPAGDLLNTLTPLLAFASAIAFLVAAAILLRWLPRRQWFRGLVIAGVLFSTVLQISWFTVWAVLPLLVNVALLWVLFAPLGQRATVARLRGA